MNACVDTVRAAAAASPLLLIVENIHNACSAARELLGRLIAAAGEIPVLLLMTSNYEELPTANAWRGAMVNAPLTIIDISRAG